MVPFTVGNFGNTYGTRDIFFFSKCLKFDVDSTSSAKLRENVFSILDNCILIVFCKFSLFGREYLSSAVKVLTNIAKGENIANRNFFQVYLANSEQKIWWKCCHSGFISVWDALTCSLSKGALKRDYPNITLAMFLTLYNFGNTLAMNVIWFCKMFKICWRFQK